MDSALPLGGGTIYRNYLGLICKKDLSPPFIYLFSHLFMSVWPHVDIVYTWLRIQYRSVYFVVWLVQLWPLDAPSAPGSFAFCHHQARQARLSCSLSLDSAIFPRTLVPFIGEWDLETRVWAQGAS